MTHGKDNDNTTPEAKAGQERSRKVDAEVRLKAALALRLVALAIDELDEAEGMLSEDEKLHRLPSPTAQHFMARLAEQADALGRVVEALEQDAGGLPA